MNVFKEYIKKLGFENVSEQNIQVNNDSYIYLYETKVSKNGNEKLKIPFVAYKDKKAFFNYHLEEWNKNELDFFVAVGTEQSYIIKVKEKPNKENPFYKDVILGEVGFNYGINTFGYEDIIPSNIPYTKENLDNSFFFNFVFSQQESIKNEIDVHLLKNLIALKTSLEEFDSDSENINFLILKCLFVKYLEDRNIVSNSFFHDVLETESIEGLQDTFKIISIINGDILKKKINITANHIKHLNYFFTHDYKAFVVQGQASLFYPYKFDKIPIQLISNIYEEFLGRTNKEEKKKKGIFYTRSFVVDFMLSQKIYPKLDTEEMLTVLDPACGSGAFLVQAFQRILHKPKNRGLSIDEKAILLKKQIFGIDIDENALHITAFSLYLVLLEGVSKEEIKLQIEKSNPILPSLIGSNLVYGNTITDAIKFEIELENNGKKERKTYTKFDCIVANPPWSELSKDDKATRLAIKTLDVYKSLNGYQTSQAFLLKIHEACKENTDIAIVVNNSNFLNREAINTRKEILEKYRICSFYELSEIAPILFKNTAHPCVILILDKGQVTNHIIKYIRPRLTTFNKLLRGISYADKDVKKVKQQDLLNEDILWRIFVNGDWRDYQLVKKIQKNNQKNNSVSCQRGFEPMKEDKMTLIGEPKSIPIYDTKNKTNYFHFGQLPLFKWNRKLRRLPLPKRFSKDYFEQKVLNNIQCVEERELVKTYYKLKDNNYSILSMDISTKLEIERILSNIGQSLFSGERIIIERTPSENNRLKSIYTNEHIVCKDNMIVFKIEDVDEYSPFLAILNSSFVGYYLTNISPKFSKGGRSGLQVENIKTLPFPVIKPHSKVALKIVNEIARLKERKKEGNDIYAIENQLDELVFDLYNLLEFEKEIIREFYQINVERKNDLVKITDVQIYVDKFREVYQLMVKDNLRLNVFAILSSNIGAIVKFEIVPNSEFVEQVQMGQTIDRQVLELVKKKQLQKEQLKGYIYEEKVKFYENKWFYIVKSNQFKDWTKKQAMDDAREEIHEMIKKLQE